VKWDTKPPSEQVDFELVPEFDLGVELYLDSDLDIRGWLDVRLWRFWRRRLVLDWPGKEAGLIGSSS